MLKNKNFNIVLALIISISLWAYVLGDVNPKIDITVRDVPIEIINEDTLINSDLTVLSTSEATINVTISGPRTEVTQVGKGDFRVTADVEALSLGENIVRLNVVGPDKGEIIGISTEKITVIVDELVTEEKDISVLVNGNVESGKEPLIIEMSKGTCNVTGAKTLVENVTKVNAVVEANQIGSSMNTMDATLVPVDADGKTVERVRLDSEKISVTSIMHHIKTVTLDVPIENMDADGYERNVSIPKTIVIKGEKATLDKVASIKCETIDLSMYTESTSVALKPILPYGVEVGNESLGISADIKVKALSKGTIRVEKDNIKLINASENLKYEIETGDLNIEITGKEADLIGIDINDFTITVDVSGLNEGSHNVELNISSSKDLASIKPSSEEVKITVK